MVPVSRSLLMRVIGGHSDFENPLTVPRVQVLCHDHYESSWKNILIGDSSPGYLSSVTPEPRVLREARGTLILALVGNRRTGGRSPGRAWDAANDTPGEKKLSQFSLRPEPTGPLHFS